MILFKGIKAKEVGGFLIFQKRKSSSSLFVVEFAVFPSREFIDPNSKEMTIGNIKKHLFIKKECRKVSREVSLFHIEFNERDESFRVFFESSINAETSYQLVWKQNKTTILCLFIINDKSDYNENIEKISMGHHSLNELFGKLLLLTQQYPELLYHSEDIKKVAIEQPTVLTSFRHLLSGAKKEWNGYANELSKFEIEKSFESLPSIEECISNILKIERNGPNYMDQINSICIDYLKNLKISKRLLAKGYSHSFFNSGFIEMCQIARNGNSFALELCNLFLSSIIGRRDDLIIYQIGDNQIITTRGLNETIIDFLSEYSLIEHGNEVIDEIERENLLTNVERLQKSEYLSFYMPRMFSNENLDSNFCIDTLIAYYEEINELDIESKQLDEGKLGVGISNEVFFNAAISTRIGSKQCLEFYNFIANNISECTNQSLLWSIGLKLDLPNTFKIFQYLKDVIKLSIPYSWIARKKIIGIPNFLESDAKTGYQELMNVYLHSKFSESAALSLGHLFYEGAQGISQDLERALFWFLRYEDIIKDQPEVNTYLKETKGIKIEHSDDYFLNFTP